MLKDTNPKDAVGVRKWRQYCTVPITIIWELGVAMLEGARKYGRHNYRVAGVRASVYIDATKGHLDSWWEGEDLDPDSGLSHITKAMASLAVLRDAMLNEMVVDDRPPKVRNFERLKADLQAAVEGIMERHPVAREPFTELGQQAAVAVAPVETPAESRTPLADEQNSAPVHFVDGVDIFDADAPEYDREHVAHGLTTKQFLKLVRYLDTGDTEGGIVGDGVKLWIRNHKVFDSWARYACELLERQPSREVRLDFEPGGFRECSTRLTNEQWFAACPGVRVTARPYHGVMRPRVVEPEA